MNIENLTPYSSDESKRVQITQAFDVIAHRYDRLNRILSFGIDLLWRLRALRLLQATPPARLLDVATGTADLAIMAARRLPRTHITGIDLSENMLKIGRAKVAAAGLDRRITLTPGDGLALAFPDASFDAVTSAFGVRNFENLLAGFREMRRVLKPGGRIVILELSEPRAFPMRPLFRFYLRKVMPWAGRLLTGHGREYRYLPASIEKVPQGGEMLSLLQAAGFTGCRHTSYTFGICSCYTGSAPRSLIEDCATA
ncbi:MAG: bifunctional demethylmenaquinone methyltransferase/2-methoxy-6-polyprenyl-1,4-benzoquinol methylase UbiE [Kiritimatiellae bacterium]|nr:bifunctional demethylmenaquinone methyltransferase/2-methoxy-6-polyprenyl-1,4-benzoquinol methylase UbiE [Kiritimatiellia bacterium]